MIVLTTPTREHTVPWELFPAGVFRHRGHRFEWSRDVFHTWTEAAAARRGHTTRFNGVAEKAEGVRPPMQMGVFERA